MPKSLPLILAEGTLSLFVADASGQPILTQPVWFGARAEGLELSAEIAEIEATPSGAVYDQFAQLSELHEISIERIWVLPIGPESGPGAVKMVDYDLRRGQYVMQVFGIDPKTGLWHQRTYYGVQAKRYGLKSNGVTYFGANQAFRAKSFTTSHGTSSTDGTIVPVEETGPEFPLLFTHDDPLVNGDYFIGCYQFSVGVTVGFTKAIGQAGPGGDTIMTLELGGTLGAQTLTLPSGSGEVSDSATFNVAVPANTTIRWKITTAPGSAQAEYAGITMRVKES